MRALVAAALVTAVGCAGEPASLSWSYAFATADLREETMHLRARLRRGGCTSEDVPWEAAFSRAAGGPGRAPPPLVEGRWGFELEGTDGSCRVIALGCADAELPGDAAAGVETLLERVAPADPSCGPARCRDGECLIPDAGPPPDTGPPPRDTGPRDVGPPIDVGPCGPCDPPHAEAECAGAICEVIRCDPGWADCDFDPRNGCEAGCPTGANLIEPSCVRGACVTPGCADGFSDCDGLIENGCETAGHCQCTTAGCTRVCSYDCTVDCAENCSVTCPMCGRCFIHCADGAICNLACGGVMRGDFSPGDRVIDCMGAGGCDM